MKRIEIFTDGACSGNPGAGGWGAILRYNNVEKELSGGEAETTNNRMELTAVISALEALKEPCNITLYTDSKYVMEGIEKWIISWKQNGWRTSNKKSPLEAFREMLESVTTDRRNPILDILNRNREKNKDNVNKIKDKFNSL